MTADYIPRWEPAMAFGLCGDCFGGTLPDERRTIVCSCKPRIYRDAAWYHEMPWVAETRYGTYSFISWDLAMRYALSVSQ